MFHFETGNDFDIIEAIETASERSQQRLCKRMIRKMNMPHIHR